MLPPVLEIYLLWHPDDSLGAERAQQFVDHFHGTAYSGLIGGAVEVFVRSTPTGGPEELRPIPIHGTSPYGIAAPSLVVVVPVLGLGLAKAVESGVGPWLDYLTEIVGACEAEPAAFGIFPLISDDAAVDGTKLGALIKEQALGTSSELLPEDDLVGRQIRDLVQGITQLSAPEDQQRVRVFISHTKHATGEEGSGGHVFEIDDVFRVITHTRLDKFFDATDLQPGRDWDSALRNEASTNALLCIRTDLYSSRGWCQAETAIAKRAGMPVVILDALEHGEERGSFLMDHVPRIPGRSAGRISERAIILSLNQLVDECLKRELWRRQKALANEVEFDWWAPHAPEPLTFVAWLRSFQKDGQWPPQGQPLRVLHPDPPLGRDETEALRELLALVDADRPLRVMTPGTLAGTDD